jgi:S-adenosylmethionine:diacylglycerol 3-amino-3-carboxypropyl transferase
MRTLYNFGLSQEDVLTEIRGTELADGDTLLCIAGAGEIPLNTAALRNVKIVAVDYAPDQLRLCKLKLMAARRLGPAIAADFLGYRKEESAWREKIFRQELAPFLEKDDLGFWNAGMAAIRGGVIHAGKFEQFIARASVPARMVIGRKNLFRLFDCRTLEEQEEIFDRRIAGPLLKMVFKTAFHPRIYTNRGVDETGMQNRQARNVGDFFFGRFRSFCCGTPARGNFMLQYIFFRQSLFPEALPEYLQDEHHDTFRRNCHQVLFAGSSMEDYLEGMRPGQFNKVILSNICDWMTFDTMEHIFKHLQDKTVPGSRMVLRHIYKEPPAGSASPFLVRDHHLGRQLARTDRFPFSNVIPLTHINHGQT